MHYLHVKAPAGTTAEKKREEDLEFLKAHKKEALAALEE
jgi:hypothetical protein